MNQKIESFLNFFLNFENNLHYKKSKNFSLENIQKFLKLIDDPQKELKFIHVAGTKGKGSTCVMIASILKEAGFKVGLYTSPHLYEINERIRILKSQSLDKLNLSSPRRRGSMGHNGRYDQNMDSRLRGNDNMDRELLKKNRLFSDAISDEDFLDIIEIIKPVLKESKISLTYFEILTVIAFEYFKRKKTDVVVLETGLGGRLDATNIVDSEISIITRIGLDHQNILGNTIQKIAKEKAGIIKSSSKNVIVAPQELKALDIIQKQCQSLNLLPVLIKEKNIFQNKESQRNNIFNYKDWRNVQINLIGGHQCINAAVAIEVSEILNIKQKFVRAGLKNVKWPGRFEVIENQKLIFDCAHNAESIQAFVQTFRKRFPRRKVTIVLGLSEDKDKKKIVEILQPITRKFILTQSSHPRSYVWKKEDLKLFKEAEIVKIDDVNLSGLDFAAVVGSVFLVADLRKEIKMF